MRIFFGPAHQGLSDCPDEALDLLDYALGLHVNLDFVPDSMRSTGYAELLWHTERVDDFARLRKGGVYASVRNRVRGFS